MIENNAYRGTQKHAGGGTILISAGNCHVFRRGRAYDAIGFGKQYGKACTNERSWRPTEYSPAGRTPPRWVLDYIDKNATN